MLTVLRFLFVIPFAFVAACLAAAFALLWPFLDVSRDTLDDPVALVELGFGFVAQAGQVGAAVLIPWAILMVASELGGLRSLLLHVASGALGGLLLSRAWYGGAASDAIETAMVVGGLAFQMVYWIIAGRSAGRWRVRSRPLPEETRP